jgi:hypothetical protein
MQNLINGGFFAKQSDPNEYFNTYYVAGKEPNIRQNPIVTLYALSMGTPQLNSLASEALSYLTSQYDANLYDLFLEGWGTHIAINTTIGGMVEQLTTVPRCIRQPITRAPIYPP